MYGTVLCAHVRGAPSSSGSAGSEEDGTKSHPPTPRKESKLLNTSTGATGKTRARQKKKEQRVKNKEEEEDKKKTDHVHSTSCFTAKAHLVIY